MFSTDQARQLLSKCKMPEQIREEHPNEESPFFVIGYMESQLKALAQELKQALNEIERLRESNKYD